jgi:hypothetical protein
MAFGHHMRTALAVSTQRRDRFARERARRRAILHDFARWCLQQQARVAGTLEARWRRVQDAQGRVREATVLDYPSGSHDPASGRTGRTRAVLPSSPYDLIT